MRKTDDRAKRVNKSRLHQIQKPEAQGSVDLRDLAPPHRHKTRTHLGVTAQPDLRNSGQSRRLSHRVEADADEVEIPVSRSVHSTQCPLHQPPHENGQKPEKDCQVEALRILGSVLGHGLPSDQDFATGRDEARHKALRAGCEEIVEA